jgi:hypothetical protein
MTTPTDRPADLPEGGMLDLDDDTPLAPTCPMRTGDASEICEACQ